MFIKNYKLLSVVIFSFLCSIVAISCHNTPLKKADTDISVLHEFPNTNWAFEEQVLIFPFENPDTTAEYQIGFLLTYDKESVQMDQIPVTVTMVAPDGMESFVTSVFRLHGMDSTSMISTKGFTTIELIAFPKKQLNQKGQYKIRIYRKADKADNYGFQSIALKVKPLKKNRLK